jgi:hypothetical protein
MMLVMLEMNDKTRESKNVLLLPSKRLLYMGLVPKSPLISNLLNPCSLHWPSLANIVNKSRGHLRELCVVWEWSAQ